MKYKYFLFDWDGSLGATLPLWFEGYQKVFREYGKELSYLDIGKKVLGDWEAPRRLGVEDVDKFYQKLEQIVTPDLPEVRLNHGAKEILKEIKDGGGKLAIVTTSKRSYVDKAIENNGISDWIDVLLGKEDVTKYKPDPEMLYLALEKMGGNVDEALVIGDTVKDVLGAKNAGIKSVLYYPDEYQRFYDALYQQSLGADMMIKSFSELSEIIKTPR